MKAALCLSDAALIMAPLISASQSCLSWKHATLCSPLPSNSPSLSTFPLLSLVSPHVLTAHTIKATSAAVALKPASLLRLVEGEDRKTQKNEL